MTYFSYVERQKARIRSARRAPAAGVYLREEEYELARLRRESAKAEMEITAESSRAFAVERFAEQCKKSVSTCRGAYSGGYVPADAAREKKLEAAERQSARCLAELAAMKGFNREERGCLTVTA